MMTDTGTRCDRHVGEVFPPRCLECGTTSDEQTVPRCGFIPGTECALHTGYPLPCARCARERDEVAA